MKIVIAPDSFKESLSAAQVAEAIAGGLKSEWPELECCCVPVADGGEGTMDALVDATGGRRYRCLVKNPLGKLHTATFGILGDKQTAVIEMAQASGIELVAPNQRDPLIATSYGTGELIKAALNKGVAKIIVAIGGSATNDGGTGMMTALGARFLDSENRPIGPGGAALNKLVTIDTSQLDPRLANVDVITACDVDNPLTGPEGASVIFGPQKGATPEMVVLLDNALKNYAACLREHLDCDVELTPGAGAAGGMGAALLAFLNAKLKPGIDIVLETVDLASKLEGADLVITGEGRIDSQTIHGKTPVGVSRLAQKYGIPTIAFAGSVGDGTEVLKEAGIVGCFSVVQGPCVLADALKDGKKNLTIMAKNLAGVIHVIGKHGKFH